MNQGHASFLASDLDGLRSTLSVFVGSCTSSFGDCLIGRWGWGWGWDCDWDWDVFPGDGDGRWSLPLASLNLVIWV
jgi:hypothetical protein